MSERKKIVRNTMDAIYQDELHRFVEREVIYSASSLVSKLAALPEEQDELVNILFMPDLENPDEYIGALEHWIVTEWLADKLLERGEMILKDYLGMHIWGRTCSGQAIILDSVIQDIYDSLGED